MPEHALRQLADHAERVVDLPDFRDLVHRAQRRRRRRHVVAGLTAAGAAALVTVVVLLPRGSADHSAPPVTPPKPTHSVTTAPSTHYLLGHPDALVNQPGAVVSSVSYAGRDDAAALWQVCSVTSQGQCPEVITWTSDGWRTSHAYRIPDKLAIYALPDGSAVVWLFDGGFVLDRAGHRHALTRSGQPVAVVPGGRYVNLAGGPDGGGPAGLLDTRTFTLHRPLTARATECLMDDQWAGGTLWELGMTRCAVHPRESVAWTRDLGRTWATRSEQRPILGIAATPQRTAILLGARADELSAVDVTTDGGRTWRLTRLQHPIASPGQFAATPDGHLFITVGSDLFEADGSWTSFHRVSRPSVGGWGLSTADGVLTTYEGGSRIAVSYDDGRTWHTVSPRPSPRG
jgi:hypothetical protein